VISAQIEDRIVLEELEDSVAKLDVMQVQHLSHPLHVESSPSCVLVRVGSHPRALILAPGVGDATWSKNK